MKQFPVCLDCENLIKTSQMRPSELSLSKIMPLFLKSTLCLFALLLALPQAASAHKVSSADVVLRVNTEDARYFQVEVQTDVESSGDAALDDEIGPLDAARLFVESNLFVLIDEKEQPKVFDAKLIETTDSDTPDELKRLSVMVTWKGKIPAGGKELSLFLDETSPLQIVLVTEKNGIIKRRYQVIYAGEYSMAENVEPLIKGNPFEMANKKDEPEPTPKTATKNPNKPNMPNHFVSGVKVSFYNMALPLVCLISLLLLSPNLKHSGIIFVIFLVFQTFGLVTEFIPNSKPIGLSLGLFLIGLNIDNLTSEKFRAWRYVAAALVGGLLGCLLTQASPFLSLTNSRSDLITFQLGFIVTMVIAATLIGLILSFGRKSRFFRTAMFTPCAIILAGVAVFIVIESL